MAAALVQTKTASSGTGYVNSLVVPLTSNVTAGNFLVAIISTGAANIGTNSPITGIGDTISSGWSRGPENYNATDGQRTVSIWYAPNTNAGADTVTINFDGYYEVTAIVQEYSGVNTTTVLDSQAIFSDGSNYAQTHTVGPTASSSTASSLVIGGYVSGSTTTTYSAGTGVTNVYTAPVSEYHSLASTNDFPTATGQRSFTIGTSAYTIGAGAIAVFKASAAAVVTPPPGANNTPNWYPYGVLPAGKTVAQLKTITQNWWTNQFKPYIISTGMPSGMPSGAMRVYRPENQNDTVSEGMGYGLMGAVLMSDYDTNAQTIFDSLWKYTKYYLNSNGLMSWHIDSAGGIIDTGSATDGDYDIAYALYLAAQKWGTTGTTFNYATERDNMLAAMLLKDHYSATHSNIDLRNVMINGDGWDSGQTGDANYYDPDYTAPLYYTAWSKYNSRWLNIRDRNWGIISGIPNGTTGLFPDRMTRGGAAASGQNYNSGYNAVRRFRQVADYLNYGSNQPTPYIDYYSEKRLADFMSTQAANVPSALKAEWAIDGSTNGGYYNSLFASSYMVSMLVNGDHSQFAADIIDYIVAHPDNSYFSNTVVFMNLATAAGYMTANFGVTTNTLNTDYVNFTFSQASNFYLKTHATDSIKRKQSTVSHSTSAATRRVSTRAHSTDTVKRKQIGVAHSTDALKRSQSVKAHSTDSLKRAALSRAHQTDSLKRRSYTKSHVTDANKRVSGITRSHGTDSYKRSFISRQHSTDAVKRVSNITRTHSTDTIKRAATIKTHSTDTIKRITGTKSHSTDSYKRTALAVSHSTSTVLRKQFTRAHSTDAVKRTQNTRSHSTNALKRANSTKSHTTDAFKRIANQKTHTTDTTALTARRINMVPNPSFEGGIATWQPSGTTISASTIGAVVGTGSLKATSQSAYDNFNFDNNPMPVIAGQWYDAQMRVTTLAPHTGGSGGSNRNTVLYVRWYNASGSQILEQGFANVDLTTVRTQYLVAGSLVAPAGAVFARLQVYQYGTGDAYYDAFSFEQQFPLLRNFSFNDYPVAQIATTANGMFANGTAAGTNIDPGYGGVMAGIYGSGSFMIDSSQGKTSPGSFKASILTAGSNVDGRMGRGQNNNYFGLYGIPIQPFTTYQISYWLKTNVTSGSANGAYIQFLTADASGNSTGETGGPGINVTQDWTQYTFNYTTGANAAWGHNEMRISGSSGAQTLIMDAWFDDIQIRRVSPTVLNYFDGSQTNSAWRGTSNASSSYTNAYQYTPSHSTSSVLRRQITRSHSTDSFKRAGFTRVHSTDAIKRAALSRSHSTDALKRISITRSHTTDTVKRIAAVRTHSTSSILRRSITLTHSTDAIKRASNILRTHSTDGVKRTSNLRTHSTSAVLRFNRTVSHTTSAAVRVVGVRTHSTDTIVRDRRYYTREQNPTLPTDSSPRSIGFSMADVGTVAADDSTYVPQSGVKYLIFNFDSYTGNNRDQFTITWNGKSTINTSTRPVYLQLYNVTTGQWENLDMNNNTVAGTDFTLTGQKLTGTTNYYDANIKMVARVYQ